MPETPGGLEVGAHPQTGGLLHPLQIGAAEVAFLLVVPAQPLLVAVGAELRRCEHRPQPFVVPQQAALGAGAQVREHRLGRGQELLHVAGGHRLAGADVGEAFAGAGVLGQVFAAVEGDAGEVADHVAVLARGQPRHDHGAGVVGRDVGQADELAADPFDQAHAILLGELGLVVARRHLVLADDPLHALDQVGSFAEGGHALQRAQVEIRLGALGVVALVAVLLQQALDLVIGGLAALEAEGAARDQQAQSPDAGGRHASGSWDQSR